MKAAALLVAAATVLAGCGGTTKPEAQTTSVSRQPGAEVDTVCAEARHELLTISGQKLRDLEMSVAGRMYEEAAGESERVDLATAARLQRLPMSAARTTALSDLERSRAELQEIGRLIRHRHGIAFPDLPKGLVEAFALVDNGCGPVRIVSPLSG